MTRNFWTMLMAGMLAGTLMITTTAPARDASATEASDANDARDATDAAASEAETPGGEAAPAPAHVRPEHACVQQFVDCANTCEGRGTISRIACIVGCAIAYDLCLNDSGLGGWRRIGDSRVPTTL